MMVEFFELIEGNNSFAKQGHNMSGIIHDVLRSACERYFDLIFSRVSCHIINNPHCYNRDTIRMDREVVREMRLREREGGRWLDSRGGR